MLIQLIYQQGPSKLVVLYNTNGRISFFTTFQSIIEPVPYLVRKLYRRTFRYDRNTGSSTWKIEYYRSTTVPVYIRDYVLSSVLALPLRRSYSTTVDAQYLLVHDRQMSDEPDSINN